MAPQLPSRLGAGYLPALARDVPAWGEAEALKEGRLGAAVLRAGLDQERLPDEIVREQPLAACPAGLQAGLQKVSMALRAAQRCRAAEGQQARWAWSPREAARPDAVRRLARALPVVRQLLVSELLASQDARRLREEQRVGPELQASEPLAAEPLRA